jgi:hypothetical protein
MSHSNDNPNRRTSDDNGLGLGVSIIAAFAIALVLGLAFWTLNGNDRVAAPNTPPGTAEGITTGIAPRTK